MRKPGKGNPCHGMETRKTRKPENRMFYIDSIDHRHYVFGTNDRFPNLASSLAWHDLHTICYFDYLMYLGLYSMGKWENDKTGLWCGRVVFRAIYSVMAHYLHLYIQQR